MTKLYTLNLSWIPGFATMIHPNIITVFFHPMMHPSDSPITSLTHIKCYDRTNKLIQTLEIDS